MLSEHIGFSVWTLWSVMVLFMGPEYGIDAAGKFFLVAVPTLVGAVLRLPYTFAVAKFGGRNWTIVSAALLLVPTILAAIVMHPGTSYTTFMVVGVLRRPRRRQLRLVDDQHQRLLPRALQGVGAGPERGRRQHRRAGRSS